MTLPAYALRRVESQLAAAMLAGMDEALRRQGQDTGTDALPWSEWLATVLPRSYTVAPAEHHREFWEWVWSIRDGARPRPFVAVWPRGGGKSESCEGAVVALGARKQRRYVVYVRSTQEQADKSVQNIAAKLVSPEVELHYPQMARPSLQRYGRGHYKAWRRNRLVTTSGLVVDALGLDTAARGAKFEEQRPDLAILDDIDEKHDNEAATLKKEATITHTLLPAGDRGALAVLAVQNLIIPDGVFSKLADGRADWLADRIVSGPHPAIVGMSTETYTDENGALRHRIVSGEPTWSGLSIEACQQAIDTEGLSAFLRERQHEVQTVEGALWNEAIIDKTRQHVLPDWIESAVVAVDPAGGKETETGIMLVGRTPADSPDRAHIYVIEDKSGGYHAYEWGKEAVLLWMRSGAGMILVEENFGGDMCSNTLQTSAAALRADGVEVPGLIIGRVRAGPRDGKKARAEPVSLLWYAGRGHILGRKDKLEGEMRKFRGHTSDPSPNRLDAMVHACNYLAGRLEVEVV